MMENAKVDLFLDTYRRLETVGEQYLGRDCRGRVVAELSRLPQFAKYADELDCCREVRNLLSHEIKVDGQYAVVPGENTQELLERILAMMEHPQCVGDRMTRVDALLAVSGEQKVLEVMAEMQQRHLSHVPLLRYGRVSGIFGVDTVFQAVLNGMMISGTTVVSDLEAYLPLDKHGGHIYRFVPRLLPVEQAEERFHQGYSRSQKVRLLLVTEHGDPEERLLGLVTPYDLMD